MSFPEKLSNNQGSDIQWYTQWLPQGNAAIALNSEFATLKQAFLNYVPSFNQEVKGYPWEESRKALVEFMDKHPEFKGQYPELERAIECAPKENVYTLKGRVTIFDQSSSKNIKDLVFRIEKATKGKHVTSLNMPKQLCFFDQSYISGSDIIQKNIPFVWNDRK